MRKRSVTLTMVMFFILFSIEGHTTISYNLADQSTFTNSGTQWDPVTSTTSPAGKVRTQVATSLWHSAGYVASFKEGNVLEIDVEGTEATVRFYGSIYSAGTMTGGITQEGSELGPVDVDLDNHAGMPDQTGYYEFNYISQT